MKRMIALLLFVAAFPAVASAQGTTRDLMPGPYAERDFRRAYAPGDRVLGAIGPGGYLEGYYYGGTGYSRTGTVVTGAVTGMVAGAGLGAGFGHSLRNNLIGAGVGAAVGGLLTYVATRPSRGYNQPAYAGDGQQVVFAQSRAQKPLDCRKPRGKRGKNEAACAAAEAEIAAQQQAARRQACLADLAASPWRLRNGSDRFTFEVIVGGQPLVVCGESVALRPLQTVRIFSPSGQIGGHALGAAGSGEAKMFEARIEAVNRPGFIGFVLMAPGVPEGGN